MRILYLTQWFDPEPGVIKGPRFVRSLEAAGHEITVVTGVPNYPTGRFYAGYRLRPIMRETIGGVKVVRLPLYPSHNASSFQRMLNFASFFVSALLYCALCRTRYDLAYVYHPPITVGFAAALSGLLRRLHFVLEIQDLWPDTVAATGLRGARPIARLLGPICAFVYRRAEAIVVQSSGMREALVSRGVDPAKITIIRNWADLDPLPEPAALQQKQERTTILYGGNFGRAQALGTVIDAAALIEQRRSDIRILLHGDGIDGAALQEHARRLGLASVEFRERIVRDEFIRIGQKADALLLHLADDPLFRVTIPSKVQFYLAMGLPIAAGISGEGAELLRESGAAMVVPSNNAEALADAICSLADTPADLRRAMGRAGQSFYRRSLAFEEGIARTVGVIESCGTGAAHRQRSPNAPPRGEPVSPSPIRGG